MSLTPIKTNLPSDKKYVGYEAPVKDNQHKSLSTLSAVGASPLLTGTLMEASSQLDTRTKEMKEMLSRLEKSGVDVKPLRYCLWNYAVAFATYKALRVLKSCEGNISHIIKEKEE